MEITSDAPSSAVSSLCGFPGRLSKAFMLGNDSVREAWGLQAVPRQKEAEGHGRGLMVLPGDRSA